MAKRWVLGLLMLFVLGSAPGPVAAQGLLLPVSGTLTSVDRPQRTVHLGGQAFYVPQGVTGFETLAPGMSVRIEYENVGGRLLVTRIETAEPN